VWPLLGKSLFVTGQGVITLVEECTAFFSTNIFVIILKLLTFLGLSFHVVLQVDTSVLEEYSAPFSISNVTNDRPNQNIPVNLIEKYEEFWSHVFVFQRTLFILGENSYLLGGDAVWSGRSF
jgi:hypothetical protein